jgi:hypothetical protein
MWLIIAMNLIGYNKFKGFLVDPTMERFFFKMQLFLLYFSKKKFASTNCICCHNIVETIKNVNKDTLTPLYL